MAPRPLVFCGPSGAGKSTLLKKLMADYPDSFGFSVSHTTRGPRPGETTGVDYHFTDLDTFNKELNAGSFLESANFSGNSYGTSFKALMDVLETGKWCILDIEIQGVQQVKQSPLLVDAYLPVYVFIKPPSLEDLKERLVARQTDAAEAIERRLQVAAQEIEYGTTAGNFDVIIVNDELDEAYSKLKNFMDPMLQEDAGS